MNINSLNFYIIKFFYYYYMKYNNIISLGGVGGCILAETLRKLNQETYPYDWLITTQGFVIKSFNNFDLFFNFDNKLLCDNNEKLITSSKNAIMLHDFKNFDLEKDEVIKKYTRRFNRLNYSLNNNNILFVRIFDNINKELYPKSDKWNNIFIREIENLKIWDDFIISINKKYNKNNKLLIITDDENISNINFKNIILYHTYNIGTISEIKKIIENTISIIENTI